MSDNFHQSVDGEIGANHIMFGHGDMIYFNDPAQANPYLPPDGVEVYQTYNGMSNPDAGVVNQIENPDSQPGTNNWWVEDGYGNSYNWGYPPPYTVSPVSGALLLESGIREKEVSRNKGMLKSIMGISS